MTLIHVEHLVKTFAGVPVLQDVSWQMEAGLTLDSLARTAVVSTLLNIISGVMSADSGTVERARGLRRGYLTQEMTVEGDRTLYEEVREAFRPLLDMQEEMTVLESRLAQQTDSAADLNAMGRCSKNLTRARAMPLRRA
jgi:ATP-binding cassette subfamily F protein 3